MPAWQHVLAGLQQQCCPLVLGSLVESIFTFKANSVAIE
jgi:hypothetical protein